MFAMLNSDDKAKVKSKKVKVRALRALSRSARARVLLFFCLFTLAFLLSSCRRDMQDQPKAIAYRESTFFKDGVASRPPVEGTVPRGYLRADREFYFGKKPNTGVRSGPLSTQTAGTPSTAQATSTSAAAMFPDDVESFPFPITKEA